MLKRLLAAFLALWLAFAPALAQAAFGTPYGMGSGLVPGGTSGTTVTITTTHDAAPGDWVAIQSVINATSVFASSISDTVGNSYPLTTTTLTGSGYRTKMFAGKLVTALPAGSTITVTFDGSTSSLRIAVATGFSGGDDFDKIVTGTVSTTANPSIALPTLSTDDQMVVVGMYSVPTITTPITEASGYALGERVGSSSNTELSWRHVTSSASDTPQWTLNTSVQSFIQAMTFSSRRPCRGRLLTSGMGC